MDRKELLAHFKKQITGLEGEHLQLASMLLYNWTEGSWTSYPLTLQQVSELKKRAHD